MTNQPTERQEIDLNWRIPGTEGWFPSSYHIINGEIVDNSGLSIIKD